jgi:abequosyltransferase
MHQGIWLSITIPTYNRASYLQANLQQIGKELKNTIKGEVEILISDNCSEDNTQEVVNQHIAQGLPIRYIRNEKNMGWGFNFFQCYNQAQGKYLIILSDDDMIYDGGIDLVLQTIKSQEFGIVCLRSYGFDTDFRAEYPKAGGALKIYQDVDQFVEMAVPQITLLSATVINKSLLTDFKTSEVEPGNFAHLHMILTCISKTKCNAYLSHYLIGTTRDNSSSYIYSKLFVNELWSLLEKYAAKIGLKQETLKRIEKKLIIGYYASGLLRVRLSQEHNRTTNLIDFDARFKSLNRYRFWLRPILTLPRPLAVPWAIFATSSGKIYNGEFETQKAYIKKRVKGLFKS